MASKKKEDPEKVYDRQQKYRAKIHKIEVTPITEDTKEKYKKYKGTDTHEVFMNELIDCYEIVKGLKK